MDGLRLPKPLFPAESAADRLNRLQQDKLDAKAEIRDALDGLAAKHGIDPAEVTRTVGGYIDDAIADLVYEAEEELREEQT